MNKQYKSINQPNKPNIKNQPTKHNQPTLVIIKPIRASIDYLENAILSKMSKRANNHSMEKSDPLMRSFQISMYMFFEDCIYSLLKIHIYPIHC